MGTGYNAVTIIGIRIPINKIESKLISDKCTSKNHVEKCYYYDGHYVSLDKKCYKIYQESINNELCTTHLFVCIDISEVSKYDDDKLTEFNLSLEELIEKRNLLKKQLIDNGIIDEFEFNCSFGIYTLLEVN